MIFVTLGTHESPFPRLIELVLAARGTEQIFVQYGHTRSPPSEANAKWTAFLSFEGVAEAVESARAVVCHAGVGTIMTVLAAGKVPIVVPRLSRYGEHVDDHQLEIAEEFDKHGFLVRCSDSDELREALQRPLDNASRPESGEALRHAVLEAVGVGYEVQTKKKKQK